MLLTNLFITEIKTSQIKHKQNNEYWMYMHTNPE